MQRDALAVEIEICAEAENSASAVAEVEQRLQTITTGLDRAGVPAAAIFVEPLVIHPFYHKDRRGLFIYRHVFEAAHILWITLPDFEKAGEIIDLLISCGEKKFYVACPPPLGARAGRYRGTSR